MREVGAEDGGLGIAAAELHRDLDGAAVWWVVGVDLLPVLRPDHLTDTNVAWCLVLLCWASTAETTRAGAAQRSREGAAKGVDLLGVLHVGGEGLLRLMVQRELPALAQQPPAHADLAACERVGPAAAVADEVADGRRQTPDVRVVALGQHAIIRPL